MEALTPIRETLFEPNNLARLHHLLDSGDFASRQQVAREICAQFDFHDSLGRPRLSSCNAALAQLQASGHVLLPTREKHGARGRPRGNVISLRKMRHFFNRAQETATAAGTE